MKYLIIVESPSKCKKIEKFLNDNDPVNIYEVVATMGHITELRGLTSIDLSKNFECKFDLVPEKSKQIELLRKKIKECHEVIIASDDDREGESIGFHVCSVFNLDLKKTKRIIFHEITSSAIIKAIANPTLIDMNKVHAQQARQVMDLLVGFQLSPQLWKHVSKENGLSAGRCQSPALRLVYDNQKEIDSSSESIVYTITGLFTSKVIPFVLTKKIELEKEVEEFLEGSANHNHVFECLAPTKSTRKQPEPLTTSKLQQLASNELHYSPKDTMKLCQTLYEGGYITYMRTDSKVYSEEFIENMKKYIEKNLEKEKYISKDLLDSLTLGKSEKKKKTKKDELAQEAHEAIRPTDIFIKEIEENLGTKEKKMYKLIWRNALESCLPPAIFQCVKAQVSAFKNNKFEYLSEIIEFPGWKIVNPSKSDNDNYFHYLQTLKQKVVIPFKKIMANVSIKDLKGHYTEAKLVQLLEENGIGRPSTFSSLIDKIQEKQYVKKQDVVGKKIKCKEFELNDEGELKEEEIEKEFGGEKNKLVIQPLGIIVVEFLERYFSSLINFEFTKKMEDDLDKVFKQELIWYNVCAECNNKIGECLEGLGEKVRDNFGTKKEEIGIFEGFPVFIKKGKFGLYASWGEKTRNLKEFGNRPIESITFEEVEPLLDEGSPILREIGNGLSIRRNPKGAAYIFYKNGRMKKPQFFSIDGFKEDYKTCKLDILKSWIKDKYDI
jgi:DNA topoisomerase-1